MALAVDELRFDAVLTVATGFVFTTYTLGVILHPVLALGLGSLLVVAGTIGFVPRDAWVPAALSGLLALVVGGYQMPRFIGELDRIDGEMTVTLVLSALVLLLAFVAVRLTAFGRPRIRPT